MYVDKRILKKADEQWSLHQCSFRFKELVWPDSHHRRGSPIRMWRIECRVGFSQLKRSKLNSWYYLSRRLLSYLLICKWQLCPICTRQNFRLILDLVFLLTSHFISKTYWISCQNLPRLGLPATFITPPDLCQDLLMPQLF